MKYLFNIIALLILLLQINTALSGITAGAINNATGKWVLDYPITSDKVLKAMGRI